MYGHVINVPTHVNVKLTAIDEHLPNADSHLLVVRTAITDSVNTCCVFGGHFNPKSLAHSNFDSSLNIFRAAARVSHFLDVIAVHGRPWDIKVP